MQTKPLEGVRACVFDAYGTLFDVSSVARGAPDGEIADLSLLPARLAR